MYHIAIVEDEKEFSEQLRVFLEDYQKEHDVHFRFLCLKTEQRF